ncbi:hypothetical protein MBLNU230_g7686t1 [Neophaeotheca triangularis]
MRYQDWDILLFPSGDHVPVQEFKTACYAVRDTFNNGAGGGGDLMPLLTSFIPSLPAGSPFAISVHSWSQQSPVPNNEIDLSALALEWQIKVTVDGYVVCKEHLPANTVWPKVVSRKEPLFSPPPENIDPSLTTPSAAGQDVEIRAKLSFPAFDPAVLSQHLWSPIDQAGRIKIEILGGYSRERNGDMEFMRLANIATFAFQPAPIELLERNRIAWPNPSMFTNPLNSQGPLTTPVSGLPGSADGRSKNYMHDRKTSWSSMNLSSPMGAMPGPPPSTPVNSKESQGLRTLPDFSNRFNARDISSSTSSSSSYPTIALPANHFMTHTYPSALATGPPKQPLEFRLPSDQIRQIIDGLGRPRGDGLYGELQRSQDDASMMPPPPAPAFARQKKDVGQYGSYGNADMSASYREGEANRRGMSRSSDVSMHAGCVDYPNCIHEDADGKLFHDAPSTPATVVRGKKEGAPPMAARKSLRVNLLANVNKSTARDFLSKLLDPPALAATTTAQQAQPYQPVLGSSPTSALNVETHTTVLTSSSPADTTKGPDSSNSTSRKRTRSSLKPNSANNSGSPTEKNDAAAAIPAKPKRKSSRKASTAANTTTATTATTTRDTTMDGADDAIIVASGGSAGVEVEKENVDLEVLGQPQTNAGLMGEAAGKSVEGTENT